MDTDDIFSSEDEFDFSYMNEEMTSTDGETPREFSGNDSDEVKVKKKKIEASYCTNETEGMEWVPCEESDVPPSVQFVAGEKPTGPHVPPNVKEPVDFFKLFFTAELVQKIVSETNSNAKKKLEGKKLQPNSMWRSWRDVENEEFLAFIATCINMGTMPLANLQEYWAKSNVSYIPFYSETFTRDRFTQIFWMLHVSNISTENTGKGARPQRPTSFLDIINSKFLDYYIPGEQICVNEMTVTSKGQISIKTHDPKKPTKWTTTAHILADSNTGYICCILPHSESLKTEPAAGPDLPKIPIRLYKMLLEKIHGAQGHHMFTDHLHTSYPLAQQLSELNCNLTGPILTIREELSCQITKPTFLKKSAVTYRRGNAMLLVWKDKSTVSYLTTKNDSGTSAIKKVVRGGVETVVKKPNVIINYRKYIGGVGRADRFASTYCFLRKLLKWCRKLFFGGMEICLNNSYILYKLEKEKREEKPLSHVHYLKAVVEQLRGSFRQHRHQATASVVDEPRLDGKLHVILKGAKRDCKKVRRRTAAHQSVFLPIPVDMDGHPKDDVEVDVEGRGDNQPRKKQSISMPALPKPLTLEEKKYLVAVERGDMAHVRRMLQKAHWKHHININCVDPLGRGALTLAIDGENLEMLELLVVMGVATKDALLQAISVEFVEAVELLLEHEELIHKEGEPYSWEKVDWNTGTFSPDITPIILAAHRNNYEIIKILLDRGATLPMPHDIRCGCEVCLKESAEDSLRFSLSRINEYRALASPSLIALSSNDPLLTAFQLSWELRNLAFTEQEAKSEYMELRRQCQKFAVDLLNQTRSSKELAIILNHDPESLPYEEGEHMKLARLELAIHMKQKKFVAHPNVQQLLAALWYDGLPGFRRKSLSRKCLEIVKVALLFPLYCLLYLIAPTTHTGKLMRKPFMKFLIHASSYLFFLFVLILVSQNADILVIKYLGSEKMKKELEERSLRQRGNPPTPLEWLVVAYVFGFIWEEIMEMYYGGMQEYLRDLWNVIDFTRNLLYVLVILLRTTAFVQQRSQVSQIPSSAFVPREDWDDFDPQLVSEGLFAAANIFSALKLIKIFSINPHLGPLQISVGRMVIDIIKFFFIYSLVLFSFACGLNQLLGYFAELERRKCYVLPDGLPDWQGNADSCMKWRRFGNLFESSQSLFWASFGMVGIDSFELTGIKAYTRFWGLLMFGSYSVINIIVLLNLLIAMMSNSYATIEEHSDTEWKFARTRLWMSYFEESQTLPPPFNIIPAPKLFLKLFRLRKADKLRKLSLKRKSEERERDNRYTAVMRALVWRYVCHQHRQAEEGPVTEDHINEVKGEVTTAKYELLEVLARNGMDVSSASLQGRDNAALGKKMKIWERQLMKNFHVAPVTGEEDADGMRKKNTQGESPLSRFQRVAKMAVARSNERKWGQVIDGICEISQIGRSTTKEALKNQQSLLKAMAEAKKLISVQPIKEDTIKDLPPIKTPELIGGTLKELIEEFREETKFLIPPSPNLQKTPVGDKSMVTSEKLENKPTNNKEKKNDEEGKALKEEEKENLSPTSKTKEGVKAESNKNPAKPEYSEVVGTAVPVAGKMADTDSVLHPTDYEDSGSGTDGITGSRILGTDPLPTITVVGADEPSTISKSQNRIGDVRTIKRQPKYGWI